MPEVAKPDIYYDDIIKDLTKRLRSSSMWPGIQALINRIRALEAQLQRLADEGLTVEERDARIAELETRLWWHHSSKPDQERCAPCNRKEYGEKSDKRESK